jgi:hypothetical protein
MAGMTGWALSIMGRGTEVVKCELVEEWEGDERMKGWQTGSTGEGWRGSGFEWHLSETRE